MDRQPLKAVKKPLTVEYMQWSGGIGWRDKDNGTYNAVEIMDWVQSHGKNAHCQNTNDIYLYIGTLEGDMRVMPGDFVVKGAVGEFYPVKPEAFAQTFEFEDCTTMHLP